MNEDDKSDLFYEIWEFLSPHAFCDRDATEWTDKIMTLVLSYLEGTSD